LSLEGAFLNGQPCKWAQGSLATMSLLLNTAWEPSLATNHLQ
jgi:hypothetical protein